MLASLLNKSRIHLLHFLKVPLLANIKFMSLSDKKKECCVIKFKVLSVSRWTQSCICICCYNNKVPSLFWGNSITHLIMAR